MERLKILVVDDESRMRKLVRDFLVKNGYDVLEAGDGEEALDIFYKQKDIALIVLDVMMPKLDGKQVCREIRSVSKVPIIMLTAHHNHFSQGNHAPVCAFCSHHPQPISSVSPSSHYLSSNITLP